jgi:hypothetical protein
MFMFLLQLILLQLFCVQIHLKTLNLINKSKKIEIEKYQYIILT